MKNQMKTAPQGPPLNAWRTATTSTTKVPHEASFRSNASSAMRLHPSDSSGQGRNAGSSFRSLGSSFHAERPILMIHLRVSAEGVSRSGLLTQSCRADCTGARRGLRCRAPRRRRLARAASRPIPTHDQPPQDARAKKPETLLNTCRKTEGNLKLACLHAHVNSIPVRISRGDCCLVEYGPVGVLRTRTRDSSAAGARRERPEPGTSRGCRRYRSVHLPQAREGRVQSRQPGESTLTYSRRTRRSIRDSRNETSSRRP